MRSFLLSPLPFIVFFILFTLFSLPKISKNIWAKIGRILSILLFIASLVVLFLTWNKQVEVGRQGFHGALVLKFTTQIESLLKEGKYNNAEMMLKKFNKNYPIVSKNLDDLEKFVSKTVRESKGQ
jgi:hypothetical protein